MTKTEYFKRFEQLCFDPKNSHLNHEQLWGVVESEYKKKTGKHRYELYATFRTAKSQYYASHGMD